MQWTVQPAGRDTWHLFRGGEQLGEVWWIRELRHPHLTMQRIVAGLNGDHGDEQPRTWSLGTEGTAGAYELRHNGETVGELAWRRRPLDPDKWHHRLLAGLNYVATRPAADPNPEPLPTGRHLKAVS